MKKKVLLILILFLFLLTLLMIKDYSTKEQARVCFKNHCFDVELAQTLRQRNSGLMFRKELGENQGMLFIYDKEELHSFWMKNTLIPLDIVWINNKEVVFISENNQPCKEVSCPSIKPSENAKYVLEVNAGMCQKIGLSVGDKIDIYLGP